MAPPINELLDSTIPSVVVVDPHFDSYKPLATSARYGRMRLHMRSSGADALKLARRVRVDAWLIAPELDDMSGHDLVPLLQRLQAELTGQDASKVALVSDAVPGSRPWVISEQDARTAGAHSLLSKPISFQDLEELLGLPAEQRAQVMASEGAGRPFVTLPIGVGAAVIAIAVLMMG